MARRRRAGRRRQAGRPAGRTPPNGRDGPVHGRRRASGDAPRSRAPRAVRARPRAAAGSGRGAGHAGRPGGARARRAVHDGRRPGALRRARVGRRSDRGRRGGHGRGRRSRDRGPGTRAGGLAAPRARDGAHGAALHRGPARDGPRRPRRRARGRGRAGGADLRDARPRPDAPRAARRGRALGRRLAHGMGLDAGDVRRAAGARGPVRAPSRAGARDLGVHRRWVRCEAGRGGRGASRSGARPRGRTSGSARARPPRGAGRRRAPILDAPDGHPRRTARRDARGRGARRGRLDGCRRMDLPRRRARALALRVPERARDGLPGQDQPARPERVPRAGSRRGGDRARAGDGRARGRARDGPARAAPREPRRPRPGIGPSLLQQAPARLLRPGRRARGLGAARRAAREPRRTASCAAWAVGHRSGGEAEGRPPMRRCASTPRDTRW